MRGGRSQDLVRSGLVKLDAQPEFASEYQWHPGVLEISEKETPAQL